MAIKKTGLGSKGMGIEALINNKYEDFKETGKDIIAKSGVLEVDINMVEPNKKQPRKYFDELALVELAESLKQYGVIQPIIVKKQGEYYELIAGERRWRAAKIAGLKKIPIIVKKWSIEEAFTVAMIENLQREDLNPMEEAESYYRLKEEFGLSQEKIAEKVGKSRSGIANSLRLLQLDERVIHFLRESRLSGGHGRTLLGIADMQLQFELAELIIEEELSVRATEVLVKEEIEKLNVLDTIELEKKLKGYSIANQKVIEETLKSLFTTKVKITQNKNKGKIEITYYSEEDLDRIFTIMKGMEG